MSCIADQRDIFVWCCRSGGAADQASIEACRSLLAIPERAREARLLRIDDRIRFVTARALLRTTLSRHVGDALAPPEWIFEADRFGKPAIVNPGFEAIHFSLAHTDGLIALGIAGSGELGVDAERILDEPSVTAIAETFFRPAEAEALRVLPETEQGRRFFAYWTLKEAFLKAVGTGLPGGLDRAAFDFRADGGIAMADARDAAAGWQVWQGLLWERFSLAVCARRTGPARLILHESTPLGPGRPLDDAGFRLSVGAEQG